MFETGATSDVVNNLVLYTENTALLAAKRDSVFQSLKDLDLRKVDLSDAQTLATLSGHFNELLLQARQHYLQEFEKDGDGIFKMNREQCNEYLLIYLGYFRNWQKAQPPFKPGDTITVLYANCDGGTIKETYTVHQVNGEWHIQNMKAISKYVEHISAIKDALIFLGDGIPYMTDTQLGSSYDNGCINIVDEDNEPEKIKQWLMDENRNPHFNNWDSIRLCYTNTPEPFPIYRKLP